jgi:2-aminoadipate transaminase
MYEALSPLNLRFQKPKGGYFFWLELPEGMDANLLLDAALKQGVSFQPGSKFSSQGSLNQFIRLCFSYYDRETLQEGVRRLYIAMNTM